jgi:hypothetical protein
MGFVTTDECIYIFGSVEKSASNKPLQMVLSAETAITQPHCLKFYPHSSLDLRQDFQESLNPGKDKKDSQQKQ